MVFTFSVRLDIQNRAGIHLWWETVGAIPSINSEKQSRCCALAVPLPFPIFCTYTLAAWEVEVIASTASLSLYNASHTCPVCYYTAR